MLKKILDFYINYRVNMYIISTYLDYVKNTDIRWWNKYSYSNVQFANNVLGLLKY